VFSSHARSPAETLRSGSSVTVACDFGVLAAFSIIFSGIREGSFKNAPGKKTHARQRINTSS
jgi:hypothetical protein